MNYNYTRKIKLKFDEAVNVTKESLKKEGFGVLTEINVKTTLKEKLGVDYTEYIILGVCNPSFAYQALKEDKQVGLFMPCNIIIYEKDGEVEVSTILPTIAMGVMDNSNLDEIAKQAEDKLKTVLDNIDSN